MRRSIYIKKIYFYRNNMLLSTNQWIFRKYINFSLLTKCLRGQVEMASWAGSGPRAVVWRPLL